MLFLSLSLSLSYSSPPLANHPAVVQRRHYWITICTQKYSTGFSSAWTWSKPVATPHRVLCGAVAFVSLSLSLGKKFKCATRNDDCLTMINYYIVLLNQGSDFEIKLFCIRSSCRLILYYIISETHCVNRTTVGQILKDVYYCFSGIFIIQYFSWLCGW